MPNFRTDVVWCRMKRFCVSCNRREWLWGYYSAPFDGLFLWALHLGPICVHNDYEIIDSKER